MKATADLVFVYVTHPDLVAACALGQTIVESSLAACVNIIPDMHAIYRWEGRVESGQEVVMIIKTRACLAEAVESVVKAAHPYDCPCVVVLPLAGGSAQYLEWLAGSVSGSQS